MNSETFVNNLLGATIDQIVNGRDVLPADQKAALPAPFGEANFFTWCTPGIPVTADDFAFLKGTRQPLDPEKVKAMSEAEKAALQGDRAYALTVAMDNFSVLVDTVPSTDGMIKSLQVWEPQNRISNIYESALKGSEVADTVAAPDAQARIDEIRAATVQMVTRPDDDDPSKTITEYRPSTMVVEYQKHAAEYLQAFTEYVTMMSRAATGDAGDVHRASMLGEATYQKVSMALDAWASQGSKAKYEKMMADLSQLEGVSMSLLKREYEQIFDRSRRTSLLDGVGYSVARLVPAGFFESSGWTNYSFSSSQLQTFDATKTQNYSGGARYGIFGGARGSHTRLDTTNSINFENTKIEFELTQVPIVRAWFREDFLTSGKWRFKPGAGAAATTRPEDLLSNGDSAKPGGKLFAYPTVLIFARNVSVSRSLYDKLSQEATRSASGSGGFSLGPFSIGAKGSYNSSERSVKVETSEDKVVVPGAQIIGFRNHMLPLCPNPDPSIVKWI